MTRPLSLACALFALLLSADALGQVRIETTAGRTFEGRVLSDDGASVQFETTAGATMTFPYERLTLPTQYRLRLARTAEDDVDANLELAQWAVDNVLYTEARRHFRRAHDADASRAEEVNERLAAARTQASREILQRAKDAQAAGRENEARDLLSRLVQQLPLEEASQEAASLLAEDTLRRKEQGMAANRAASSGGGDGGGAGESATRAGSTDFSDQTRELFSDAVDAYKRMLDDVSAGLREGSNSRAIRSFESALDQGDRALRAGEKAVQSGKGEADEMERAMAMLKERVMDESADTRIHMADAYILRGSEKQASDVINEGLAEDPKNERLLAARARVAAAANDSDWGWVIQRPSGGGGIRR